MSHSPLGIMTPYYENSRPIPNVFTPGYFSVARNQIKTSPETIASREPRSRSLKRPPPRNGAVAPLPTSTPTVEPSPLPASMANKSRRNRPQPSPAVESSSSEADDAAATSTTLIITGLNPALAQARHAVAAESILIDAIERADLTAAIDLNALHVSIIGGLWARHVVDPSSSSCSMIIPLQTHLTPNSRPASWYGTTIHELLSLPYTLLGPTSTRPSNSLLSLQLLTADEASIMIHTYCSPLTLARGISTKSSTVSRQILALREYLSGVNPLAAANCAIIVVYIRHNVYLDPTKLTQSRRSEKCLAVYSLSPIARLEPTSLIRSRGFHLQLESSATRIASKPLALAASDPSAPNVAISKRKRRGPHCALPTPCINVHSTSHRGPAILSAMANAIPSSNIADSYWSNPTTFTILLDNGVFPGQPVMQSCLAQLGVSQVRTSEHAPGMLGNYFVFPTSTSFFSLAPPSVRPIANPSQRNPVKYPSITLVTRDFPPLPSQRTHLPPANQNHPSDRSWAQAIQTPMSSVRPIDVPPADSATIASLLAEIATTRQMLVVLTTAVSELFTTVKNQQQENQELTHLGSVVAGIILFLPPTAFVGTPPAGVLGYPQHFYDKHATTYGFLTNSDPTVLTSDMAPVSIPIASKS